jgi:hypothetical protein
MMMRDLIYKLKLLAASAHASDAPTIIAAIERIIELEEKLADYEDDITDWQSSIETQMRRRKEDR